MPYLSNGWRVVLLGAVRNTPAFRLPFTDISVSRDQGHPAARSWHIKGKRHSITHCLPPPPPFPDILSADIYVLKCQEIGETPSSKVMAQMKKPHANMAHCKLGR